MWVSEQKRRKDASDAGIATIATPLSRSLASGISRHKSRITEMVFGDLADCECEKEFVQLSTGARLRFEPKDSMVHNGSYSRGDGKERGRTA